MILICLSPNFFSMKLRKDWGQPKIMTDKTGAFLCVRLTDHTKLQLHLLQQKLNPSRSLSSFAVKLDPKFAIKIIYSEYNKIIIKLNCTNNYAIIHNLNKWQWYAKVGNKKPPKIPKKKTLGDRHPKTPWRLMFLLDTENIIENIKVYLTWHWKQKSIHVIQ